MPTGLGDEQLWISATNDNTGTSTAFDDQSGQGNNGTAVGTLVVADTSEGGSFAFDFDGTDDYIDCGAVFRPTGNFSISFWVLNDTTAKAMYVSKNWDGTSEGYVSRYDGGAGNLKFYTYSSGTSYGTDVANPFTTSQWACVTNVYNGTHWEIYIDGVLASQTAQTQPPYNSPSDLWIGATSVAGWNLDGRMDDIRMFDRALTQSEITHLAEARGIEGPPPVGLGDEQLWLCPSLNDSANDISGNGNDGTYNGGMGTVADTSNGGSRCYDFDGVNDQIDLPSSIQTSLGTTVQSFSLWMKRDVATGNGGIIGLGTNASRQMWVFGSFVHDVFYDGSSMGSPATGVWRHVAGTIDGTSVRLYLNGVLVTTGTATQPIPAGSSTKNFIGYIDGLGRFDGLMDDIRVYDRAITQSEITHLASQRGVEGPPPVGLGDEQLWLCPSINDSANDISGSGNNGTYNNGIATVADTDATYGGSRAYFSNAGGQSVSVANFGESLAETTTISLWAKSINPNRCVPIVNGGLDYQALQWQYVIFNSGTTRIFYNRDTSTNFLATPPNNQWQHICIVRETGSSTQEIYFDGTLVATAASSTAAYLTNTLWSGFGTNTVGTGEELFVDDIRTYGRALTQAEITHLATSRGIEGSPSTPTAQYNAFITHAFKQLFQTRLR